MNVLFDNIKSLADKNNMTIKDVEKLTGLTNGQIGKWKSSKPNIYKVQLVAQYFGVSIDSLLSPNKADFNNTIDFTVIDLKNVDGYMNLNLSQREQLKQDLLDYLSYKIYKALNK
ncbi:MULTISPECIES: helix-turn-helix domain-containing protein [Mammaliicoccus]|uniref:helix-turn-helix domain-containing protein n=1 Tax=Mammaliicoccus TaxID=2803850 RepID=UPI001EFB6210|nr:MULTISPECIES: helix-turn-helix transcriptional regulator [Mammaliicoccus]UXU70082.1 helix-turn-helix domain-containing protein [Mammaliicoccus sciuri]WQL34197.1 helix-turn-helix transcriptional regulator [Mammaliicoccus sciuri]WQL61136.1 helix-turn-helix transcriptional regulator [Mammaliicoccus sciuri]